MPQYLFAYGTLQPGLAPDAIRPAVDRLTTVGPGTAAGTLYDLGDYPGAIFGGPAKVHGRVFRLPPGDEPAVLAAFDAYEGVPGLYVRRLLAVTLTGGQPLTCWAYESAADVAGRPVIASGVYRR